MISDLDEILAFENEFLLKLYPDESDRMIAVWNSRFRRESLEHHLQLGWSFGAFDDQSRTLVGYFLGQPLLFFEGQTQTLWVEHLQVKNQATCDSLVEIACKLSREKHFQRVILPKAENINASLGAFKPQPWDTNYQWVKTTK